MVVVEKIPFASGPQDRTTGSDRVLIRGYDPPNPRKWLAVAGTLTLWNVEVEGREGGGPCNPPSMGQLGD
jgi:hypothetical protein